ncbi:MAG: MATE family efflux transporter [Bacteroidales bacterium]|nr:MATE family efflux transporter [Bacteroidales bacterium]
MKNLTEGKEGKLILQFAWPLLIGNIFQQLYSVVDSVIVGNYLGSDALAAIGASFPIIFTMISFVIGIAGGFTIIISQYFGAQHMQQVRHTIDTMYIFLFFAAITISTLGLVFTEEIFSLMQVPESVMPFALSYLQTYFAGIILFFGFNAINAILRGLGDSKTPLYFLIIATMTNIGFDYLFVVVLNTGIFGAALATIISQGGAFITAIFYLNRTHSVVKLTTLRLYFDRSIFKKSLRIGLPSGLQNTFVSLAMMTLFGIVNTFGANTAAAYSVALRINALASTPAMNFAAALSTFVGQNLGANKPSRVNRGLKSTLLMASSIVIVMTGVIISFKTQLMGLFTDNPEVISIGAHYLVIVSSFYLIFSTMFIFSGVMRGAGDTIVPMIFTLISLWVIRIPVAYFLSDIIGVDGIWWASPIGWFTGMAGLIIYYYTGKWKKKVVVQHDKSPLAASSSGND